MNIKILLLCTGFCAFLYGTENSLDPQKGTLNWLYWSVDQSPRDTLYSSEVKQNLDHYIQLLKKRIKHLEEKAEQSPIIVTELRKAGLFNLGLFTTIFLLGALRKKYVGISYASTLETIMYLAAGSLGLSVVSEGLSLLIKSAFYTDNLQSRLNSNERLLISLELLKSAEGQVCIA